MDMKNEETVSDLAKAKVFFFLIWIKESEVF